MFGLPNLLGLLTQVPAAIAKLDDFKAVFNAAKSLLSGDDQAIADEAYADLMADNDAGHARLQEKLAEAAKR